MLVSKGLEILREEKVS